MAIAASIKLNITTTETLTGDELNAPSPYCTAATT